MPKRLRVELAEIASWSNLTSAAYKASRRRRNRRSVDHFLKNLDQNLELLANEIMYEGYYPGRYTKFLIRDPKPRVIHAPSFRDRVVHHAIINRLGSHLDKGLVDQSFACRKGKGPVAAVKYAMEQSRKFPWYAKIDIHRYFASIDHGTLKQLLAKRLKGNGLLRLLYKVVGSFNEESGKGLPIGALTSQYFANMYLNESDRWLCDNRPVCSMIRYMDDTVCWFNSKSDALQLVKSLRRFLETRLQLSLNPKLEINRSKVGVTFCGFRIFPGEIRLTRQQKRKFVKRLGKSIACFAAEKTSSLDLQQELASHFSMIQHANSSSWVSKVLSGIGCNLED